MLEYFEKLGSLLEENVPFVQVTVVETQGSVPQHAGSKMLVTSSGLHYGTVGGGKVEKRAIEEAQTLLGLDHNVGNANKRDSATGASYTKLVEWSLTKDIGMTCGGSVKFYFEVQNVGVWNIVVFGAGHVANALVGILAKLDAKITCFDTRRDWLERLPKSKRVRALECKDLPEQVKNIPDNAFVVLVTMGHSTDKPVLIEILKNWNMRKFPYLGVIGSKAKAQRLKEDIALEGLPESLNDVFICPMGLPIGNNHPQEIALSIAAQLLEKRDSCSNGTIDGCKEK